jgi:hypothetical protein
LYEPSATERLSLEVSEIAAVAPMTKQKTLISGFPAEESDAPQFPRVVSENCLFTGKKGILPPVGSTPGYDGLLYETSCEAWWGMSGGPVMIEDHANQSLSIIGVVTHTFHIDDNGEPDPNYILQDRFGNYIKDVAISPMIQTQQLQQVLSSNVASLPQPSVAFDAMKFCGYDNLNSLVKTANAAVDFFASSAATFEPTFWVPRDQTSFIDFFKTQAKEGNAAAVSARNENEARIPWAKIVYRDFDSMQNSPKLSPLVKNNLGQLVITDDKAQCPDLECTDYSKFIVLINKNSVDTLRAKLDPDTHRKILKGVLGHEFGHFILDYYLMKSQGVGSVYEAHEFGLGSQYHLTVDAIGMNLAGFSANDYLDILLKSGSKITIFGDERIATDIADRTICLEKLAR